MRVLIQIQIVDWRVCNTIPVPTVAKSERQLLRGELETIFYNLSLERTTILKYFSIMELILWTIASGFILIIIYIISNYYIRSKRPQVDRIEKKSTPFPRSSRSLSPEALKIQQSYKISSRDSIIIAIDLHVSFICLIEFSCWPPCLSLTAILTPRERSYPSSLRHILQYLKLLYYISSKIRFRWSCCVGSTWGCSCKSHAQVTNSILHSWDWEDSFHTTAQAENIYRLWIIHSQKSQASCPLCIRVFQSRWNPWCSALVVNMNYQGYYSQLYCLWLIFLIFHLSPDWLSMHVLSWIETHRGVLWAST